MSGERDLEMTRRAARAIALVPGPNWRPLVYRDQAMELVIGLGLATAIDRQNRVAYAGSIGLPHEDNPVSVPYALDEDAGPALCRAIVTHAAARCETTQDTTS